MNKYERFAFIAEVVAIEAERIGFMEGNHKPFLTYLTDHVVNHLDAMKQQNANSFMQRKAELVISGTGGDLPNVVKYLCEVWLKVHDFI